MTEGLAATFSCPTLPHKKCFCGPPAPTAQLAARCRANTISTGIYVSRHIRNDGLKKRSPGLVNGRSFHDYGFGCIDDYVLLLASTVHAAGLQRARLPLLYQRGMVQWSSASSENSTAFAWMKRRTRLELADVANPQLTTASSAVVMRVCELCVASDETRSGVCWH